MRPSLLLTIFICLLCAALGLSGCFKPRPRANQPEILSFPDMSDQARASFAYLRYLHLDGDEALQALDTALALDPTPELFLEKIQTLSERDEYARAEQTAREALELFPGQPGLSLALLRSLWAQSKNQEAVSFVNKTLDLHPKNWDLRSRLASLLLQQDQASTALDILQAIPEKSRTAHMYYLLAQAQDALDNRKKAIEHLQQATQIDPSYTKAWAELAYQYELNRDFVAAEQAYTTLLEIGEVNQHILTRLVEIKLKLNKPTQALDLLFSHARLPRIILYGIGLFVQNSFYDHAEQALRKFGPDIADSPRGIFYRAILALELHNDLDRTLALLGQISHDSDLHPRALALRCQLLWEKESPEAALHLARQGQEQYPEQVIFYTLQASIYRSLNDFDAAKEILQSGLNAVPQNTELLFELGVLAYEQGREQTAVEHMEEIISLDPDHAKALNFLGYTLVEQEQNLFRAKILIEKALALDPENGYYLDSLAWYQYTIGHHQKAWDTIQTAVSLVADDPVIWEHYGDIARALDHKKQARKGYRRALKFNPEDPKRLHSKLQALTDPNGKHAP
ncbi:MAG: tetratricopeptide repeat protein [Desulfovermiculus sp.]